MGSRFTLQVTEGLLRVTIQIGKMGICMEYGWISVGKPPFWARNVLFYTSLWVIYHINFSFSSYLTFSGRLLATWKIARDVPTSELIKSVLSSQS